MKKMMKGTLFLAIALLICSCTTGKVPSITTIPQTEVAYVEKESYIIGPSDVLEINVWKEPDLTRNVEVRMDGMITLPMINDIQAENMTLMELQEKIEEGYKEFVSMPEVTVILVASNSRRVYMLGKVGSPGEYPLKKSMTFLQAISIANGLGRWADKGNIRLIRKIDGEEQTFRIDYDAIVSGKDLSQNILLQPDDTIFVP
jgi:polysaccharide export outer membrane protein